MARTDARSDRTRRTIKQVYLDLLEAGTEPITISRLCVKANIHRGTFYHHFADIRDVRETLETELFEDVARQLQHENIASFSCDFFLRLIDIVKRNRPLVSATLTNLPDSCFFNNIVSYFRHKYLSAVEKESAADKKEINSLFTYILYGFIGLLSEWLHAADGETEQSLAEKASRFNRILTRSLTDGRHAADRHTLP